MPAGFVPNENILVNQPVFSTLPRLVQRFWHSQDDRTLSLNLTQNPTLGGIGAWVPAMINGVPAERELLPAPPPDRPHPMLSLFWRDGEFGYVLSGNLAGPLTEETLLKIAASVRLP